MFLIPRGYVAAILLKIDAIGKWRKHESHIIFRWAMTHLFPLDGNLIILFLGKYSYVAETGKKCIINVYKEELLCIITILGIFFKNHFSELCINDCF